MRRREECLRWLSNHVRLHNKTQRDSSLRFAPLGMTGERARETHGSRLCREPHVSLSLFPVIPNTANVRWTFERDVLAMPQRNEQSLCIFLRARTRLLNNLKHLSLLLILQRQKINTRCHVLKIDGMLPLTALNVFLENFFALCAAHNYFFKLFFVCKT